MIGRNMGECVCALVVGLVSLITAKGMSKIYKLLYIMIKIYNIIYYQIHILFIFKPFKQYPQVNKKNNEYDEQ